MVSEADRKNNYNFLEVVILVGVRKMRPGHWRKECVNIINDWTCACATDSPVLVVLINHKYKRLEVVK